MSDRLNSALFYFVVGYGCYLPFHKSFCDNGSIAFFSPWDRFIDNTLYFNSCALNTNSGMFLNEAGIFLSLITFGILWLVRWLITGKHVFTK